MSGCDYCNGDCSSKGYDCDGDCFDEGYCDGDCSSCEDIIIEVNVEE